MAEPHSYYWSSYSDKRKKASKSPRYIIHRQRDEIKEDPPALTPPPVAGGFLLPCSFWTGISQPQWPPANPAPLGLISLWRAARRLVNDSICPLSIPSRFPPLSRASSAGLFITCSGERDVPESGLCCFRSRTTRICHSASFRNVSGTCPLWRVRTSVSTIWLPEAPRYSLGWVSCSQLRVSASFHDVCGICTPPSQHSPPSLLLRFNWSCSP